MYVVLPDESGHGRVALSTSLNKFLGRFLSWGINPVSSNVLVRLDLVLKVSPLSAHELGSLIGMWALRMWGTHFYRCIIT